LLAIIAEDRLPPHSALVGGKDAPPTRMADAGQRSIGFDAGCVSVRHDVPICNPPDASNSGAVCQP
jgi:hypothetical protein